MAANAANGAAQANARLNSALDEAATATHHGAAPSPDNTLLATTGRGTSNVYLIDTRARKVVGNQPNPQARDDTNPEILSSGILVGREQHEPTFTRNGRELWVTVRGESRIAILDVGLAREGRADAVRTYLPTLNGPAQAWFSADGGTAFVTSQKMSAVDVFAVEPDGQGFSRPRKLTTLDLKAQDPFGFTPFLKTSPDGAEVWLSHKLADAVSTLDTKEPVGVLDTVPLGRGARPNHVEFVENPRGKVVYTSFARVDDNGPGGVAASQIAIIDRSAQPGQRKVARLFFSHGREAHGLWTNPENTLLYIAHEQDELPGTPSGGQTVCTAFDVSDPFDINLVYVRPGAPSQSA